jgi:uncharacterized membrane protein YdbT with pleckstrin-like domain
MSYVSKSLVPGEVVIFSVRPHWRIFLGPLALLLVTGCSLSGFIIDKDMSVAKVLAGLLFLSGLRGLIGAVISYATTEFAVTNRRVMAKTGWWQRRSLELLLRQVESVSVNQRLLGRLLGYGDVVITGSGGTWESFPNIAAPLELRRRVNNQVALATS